ncbi:hypothetical protein [Pseudopelagicola sp. nBUS_19]|uniref:hypothetical protein n=1 Tax=Pseudopelagicola sp. nBUS_19 TaxID=3395316 RepID=UPI003EC0113E
MERPKSGLGRVQTSLHLPPTAALSALLAFVQRIANGSFEPTLPDAATYSNGRYPHSHRKSKLALPAISLEGPTWFWESS